ncbi:hypothetical protein OROGR_000613 [Orobanche gracilis]
MALAMNLIYFLLFILIIINTADSNCPKSFQCGNLGTLEFPLADRKGCGLFMLENCSSVNPSIRFTMDGPSYSVLQKISTNKYSILDLPLHDDLAASFCLGLRNLSLPVSPSSSFTFSPNLTVYLCANRSFDEGIHDYFEKYSRANCSAFDAYYEYPGTGVPVTGFSSGYCPVIQVPVKYKQNPDTSLSDLLSPEYVIEWNVSEDCYECHRGGGRCLTNSMNKFHCDKDFDVGERLRTIPPLQTLQMRDILSKGQLVLIVSIASGGGLLLILGFLIFYIIWQRKKRMNQDYLLSRNISFDPSSKSDVEGGSSYYGIPIFSYTELEVATNNFDPSREVGDGGFGTVYYGKLQDGREVAIKRLYEHNFRRVEQFMNEIKILTYLRHKNLVSLYGCTSRRSQELLLVYEYISNGTVADHLHGKRAKKARLSWSVRMSIALETANALAYLHKSDIIHRDVKTCNILLDENFGVKVADFGLSRLFPTDVTHISTAPQGTPGYVDPEYHQCYQLSDKSDVYSFGVVLIELVSSMVPVDITRHRHEINLANLAVNRIQRCAFDELIDSSLGYGSDAAVTRMTTSVAELAFRCLQLDKDMRPSMEEVVDFLRDIQRGGEDCKHEKVKGSTSNSEKISYSPETDDVVLLKNKNLLASPQAVTDSWVSNSSTTTSSIG